MTQQTISTTGSKDQELALQLRLQTLTTLYDVYARRAVERLCHGRPWHSYQLLAEEVEFQIARLAPHAYPAWQQEAMHRELAWYAGHEDSDDASACRTCTAEP
jgi:hypothetical protein